MASRDTDSSRKEIEAYTGLQNLSDEAGAEELQHEWGKVMSQHSEKEASTEQYQQHFYQWLDDMRQVIDDHKVQEELRPVLRALTRKSEAVDSMYTHRAETGKSPI